MEMIASFHNPAPFPYQTAVELFCPINPPPERCTKKLDYDCMVNIKSTCLNQCCRLNRIIAPIIKSNPMKMRASIMSLTCFQLILV